MVYPWRDELHSATTQYKMQLLFEPLRTMAIAVAVCTWEFIAEISRSNGAGPALMLIGPQFALFLIVATQFFSTIKLRIRTQIIVITTVIFPMTISALIYSSFRMGVGLCCCSRSLCPVSLPTGPIPDTSTCGLFMNNCYMAFIRKIAHFYGAASSQLPLVTIIFATLSETTRQIVGRRLCQAFLAKTR